jgi:hypothetical protein
MKNFRGNILDRQFPVQFDPSSGQYSYNYADVTPNISSKLKNLKYYRKSSKDLTEIEADLAAFLKKEGPAAPPVKGNITKAAEGEVAKLKAIEDVAEPLRAKEANEGLSGLERDILEQANTETVKLQRPKKVDYAKQQQEKIYNEYNRKMAEGEPVNMNANTKRAKLSAENQAKFDSLGRIIKAATALEGIEGKEARGEALSEPEKAKKALNQRTIDALVLPPNASSTNINRKGEYNNARARLAQLQTVPDEKLTLQQKANRSKIMNTMIQYERNNPNARRQREEREAAKEKGMAEKTYRNSKQKLNTLSKKAKPLSPENTAEETRLQGLVNAYRANNPNANAENVEVGNFFNANRPAAAPMNKPKAVTGGRRTRKAKKSKRKTRKH